MGQAHSEPRETRMKHHHARNLLVLLLVVAQFGSYLTYMLSYVPFGRQMLSKCVGKATGLPL